MAGPQSMHGATRHDAVCTAAGSPPCQLPPPQQPRSPPPPPALAAGPSHRPAQHPYCRPERRRQRPGDGYTPSTACMRPAPPRPAFCRAVCGCAASTDAPGACCLLSHAQSAGALPRPPPRRLGRAPASTLAAHPRPRRQAAGGHPRKLAQTAALLALAGPGCPRCLSFRAWRRSPQKSRRRLSWCLACCQRLTAAAQER